MIMKKSLLFSCFLFACITSMLAQNKTGKILGTIQDADGKPLPAVSVSLLLTKDSSLAKTAVTNKEGIYEFEQIAEGNYFISTTFVGYEKGYTPSFAVTQSAVAQVAALQMIVVAKGMSEVVITAKKPFIETKIDKTVVNVDASPTSAGATALEILEKSPGISVDNDGNISLRGKAGVVIMLDGKLSYLSAADLANLLKNMPASALDQIEIMTNPSSKYDAAGNSGVINIKTKKGKTNGFNGSFMVGITSSIYRPANTTYFIPKSQNSFNFNWRKNKINLFGNYNPNVFKGRNTLTFENRFLDDNKNITGYNNTETNFKFRNNNHTLKLGLDWFANKKNSFGIVVSGFEFSGHPTPTTIGNLSDENRILENRLVSNTKNDIKFKNGTLNLNWKHVFDSAGRELTADFDYVVYNSVSDMVLTTDYYNGQLQLTGKSSLRGHLPSDIDIYTFKTDYTHPVKGGRIEAGLKFSYVKNDNEVNYENLVNDKWVADLIRSNHFIYDENINAAYVNFNKEIKKWSFQAGLRVENTIANGNQLGNQLVAQTKFKRDTTNLFPTAFVSYKLNDNNNFTVSYGRRINRPNYQDLNPFTYFLDSLSYRQGNIYLKPQYSHNIELSHAFKGKYITTLSYNTTDNVISQINKVDPNNPDSKIRFLTIDNVAKFRNLGIAVTTPVTVNKWWSTNIFTNVFYTKYKGVFDTVNIDLSFTSFMINVTNSFTFGKGFSGEISGFYRHKGVNNLTTMQAVYQVALAVQQQVMKGKGTLRLNIRDPFAWQQFGGDSKYGRIDGSFLSRPDVRQVTASFTYRFGKTGQQNQAPRRRNSASQDEQNRVGQGGQ
jgi:iron complex outermembrane recepter protein